MSTLKTPPTYSDVKHVQRIENKAARTTKVIRGFTGIRNNAKPCSRSTLHKVIGRCGGKPETGRYPYPFLEDTDRIIHTRAYSRYIDKTQVFYLVENDRVTHRVIHVQLVSKIAHCPIGRCLRLNEDLIEAIALRA